MKLPPLTPVRLLRRYKRFLADVAFDDGTVTTVHCPNTGSMTGCWAPGVPAEISRSQNPKRKLPWTLERVNMGAGWIGVNTARTNDVVREAIHAGRIPTLSGFGTVRREVAVRADGPVGARLDLLLSDGPSPDVLVEVKNVTLLDGDCLRFPDAASTRALKHLDALESAVGDGMRAALIFALNRPEGRCFAPAEAVHPQYAARLREVNREGVEIYALRIVHTRAGMTGKGLVPVELET